MPYATIYSRVVGNEDINTIVMTSGRPSYMLPEIKF